MKNKSQFNYLSYLKNIIILSVIICFSLFCYHAEAKTYTKKIKTKVQQVIKPRPNDNLLTVHFINVGEGDSILLTFNQESVLVDSGVKENRKALLNYLMRQGVGKLKYVIGTHPHKDHIGATSYILDNLPVYKVMMPNYANNEACYKEMMQAIRRNNIPVIHPKPEKEFEVGKAKIKVLAPLGSKYNRENDYSIVLKVTYGSVSFLLAGDAEKESEQQMLKKYGKSLKSTFLKVGHHGSNTSSSNEFLKAVSPKYAIISVGPNTFGHPGNKALQRLYKSGAKVLRTDIHKDISLSTDGKKLFWR